MAIPKFEQFLYPFLLQLKDKNVTTQKMRQLLAEYFNLTKEDCAQRTKSGNVTQFNDRINWSRQYLRRAGMIEIPTHGVYQITKRGKDFLETHKGLTIKELKQIPEFAEFAQGKAQKKPKISPTIKLNNINEEITPTEQLEIAYQKINDGLVTDILDKVLEQSPSFFEHLVFELLLKMGYGDPLDNHSHVTPPTNDEGVDGIIYEDKLGLDKIYYQAKRYKEGNKVQRNEMQAFVGALAGKNANKGVFITTSSFVKSVSDYVRTIPQKIVLIDGEKLARYMIEYNVGVSIYKTYKVKKIDTDYFEDL